MEIFLTILLGKTLDYPHVLVAPFMALRHANFQFCFFFSGVIVKVYVSRKKPGGIFVFPIEILLGDEIDSLGDSWCFLLWSSDLSPGTTHSTRSRFPIAIVPSSLYMIVDGINITIEALTLHIKDSFNKLSSEGVKIRNLQSLGGGIVAGSLC